MDESEGLIMQRSTLGMKLVVIRERRMWTKARLAEEAGWREMLLPPSR